MASALSTGKTVHVHANTLQTWRGRTRAAGCARPWFRTAEPFGERRYENWITHTKALCGRCIAAIAGCFDKYGLIGVDTVAVNVLQHTLFSVGRTFVYVLVLKGVITRPTFFQYFICKLFLSPVPENCFLHFRYV